MGPQAGQGAVLTVSGECAPGADRWTDGSSLAFDAHSRSAPTPPGLQIDASSAAPRPTDRRRQYPCHKRVPPRRRSCFARGSAETAGRSGKGRSVSTTSDHIRLCLLTKAVASNPAAAHSFSKGEDSRARIAASLVCSRRDSFCEKSAEPDTVVSMLLRTL